MAHFANFSEPPRGDGETDWATGASVSVAGHGWGRLSADGCRHDTGNQTFLVR